MGLTKAFGIAPGGFPLPAHSVIPAEQGARLPPIRKRSAQAAHALILATWAFIGQAQLAFLHATTGFLHQPLSKLVDPIASAVEKDLQQDGNDDYQVTDQD